MWSSPGTARWCSSVWKLCPQLLSRNYPFTLTLPQRRWSWCSAWYFLYLVTELLGTGECSVMDWGELVEAFPFGVQCCLCPSRASGGSPDLWAGAGGIKLTAYSRWGRVNGKGAGWRWSVHAPRWECCRWTQGEMRVTGTMGRSTLGLGRSWWPLVSVTAVGTTGKQKGFHSILFRVSGFVWVFLEGGLFQEHLGKSENWQISEKKCKSSSLVFCIFALQGAKQAVKLSAPERWLCCLRLLAWVGFPALSAETLKMQQVYPYWVT